ncbi:hypothetical protein CEXT_150611 [Caerostris extrusa]|uniref:Uncharacterized protein n=1 Tax=Caerostris extrusa TaxID=172846 RepID=A0AAV4QAI2_CAEEX|nr:hypothetical protein CEXT_150611 [Caerostris extrusa]
MADFVKNRDGEKEKGKGLNCSDGCLKDENSRKTDDNVKRKFENEDIDGVALDDTEPKKQKVSVGFNKTFGSLKTIRFSEKESNTYYDQVGCTENKRWETIVTKNKCLSCICFQSRKRFGGRNAPRS